MKKEEEIKEAKVIKAKSKTGIYVVICVCILLVFAALVIALNNIGLIDFSDLGITPKKNVTLNYTTTNDKIKEGIYITDVSDVVEEVMPSIVAITSKTLVNSGNYGPFFYGYGSGSSQAIATGAGSGIIVSQNDSEILILTNNHVVEDADELSVQFVDEKSVDAVVKGTSKENDVAVIAVSINDVDKDTLETIKIATMGDSSALKVGDGVIAIGNALGYGQSVTTGVVSALNREVKDSDGSSQKMIQMDAAINGGNSGGALLNSSGEVVGINSAKYSSSGYSGQASIEGMGFAIPISDVKDIIEDLMNGKSISPSNSTGGAVIGISGDMITGRGTTPTGFYVSEVTSKNASKAGIEVGCIITEVEGKDVTSMDVISDILKTKSKGDNISLKASCPNKDSYKEKTIKVTLS